MKLLIALIGYVIRHKILNVKLHDIAMIYCFRTCRHLKKKYVILRTDLDTGCQYLWASPIEDLFDFAETIYDDFLLNSTAPFDDKLYDWDDVIHDEGNITGIKDGVTPIVDPKNPQEKYSNRDCSFELLEIR